MVARGFTLVEVVIALGILVGLVTTTAQLSAVAIRANQRSGATTTAVVLAQDKLEELLASATPGAVASPVGALAASLDGWSDAVDRSGHTVPAGGSSAEYVRRWTAEPLASGTIVFQVTVAAAGSSARVLVVSAWPAHAR